MASDGTVDLFLNIQGANPDKTKTAQDECWGVLPVGREGQFAAVLSIKMTEIRDSTKGNFKDMLLALFKSDGSVIRSTVFTNGNIQKNFNLAGNAFVVLDDMYFWAGHSIGYQTRLQKLIYAKDPKTGALTTNKAKTDLDAFIYRHIFDRQNQYCVFSKDVTPNEMERRIETYSGMSYIEQYGLVVKEESNEKVPKERLNQKFQVPYKSAFAGGFSLLDAYKIPRPCAYKSYNMTEAEYYRGQNEM